MCPFTPAGRETSTEPRKGSLIAGRTLVERAPANRLDRVESRDWGQQADSRETRCRLWRRGGSYQRPLLQYSNRSREPGTETVPGNPDAGQAAGCYVATSARAVAPDGRRSHIRL